RRGRWWLGRFATRLNQAHYPFTRHNPVPVMCPKENTRLAPVQGQGDDAPRRRRPRTMRFPAGPALMVGMFILAPNGLGQALPIEWRPTAPVYNYQSQRGVPISSVVGDPPGSDGRAPSPASGSIGTSNQWQHLLSFAAGVGSGANASRLDPSQSYAANANNLNLPRGVVSGGLVILLRAQFGNPIQGAKATHFFGDVIAQPQQDEYGVDLALPNNGVNPPRLPV